MASSFAKASEGRPSFVKISKGRPSVAKDSKGWPGFFELETELASVLQTTQRKSARLLYGQRALHSRHEVGRERAKKWIIAWCGRSLKGDFVRFMSAQQFRVLKYLVV
jgi:hypothetical protein